MNITSLLNTLIKVVIANINKRENSKSFFLEVERVGYVELGR
jgi:hypothetical protein